MDNDNDYSQPGTSKGKQELKPKTKNNKEQKKAYNKAYNKAYYQRNKEKIQAYNKAHKEQKKAYDEAYQKKYRQRNKEQKKAYDKAHKEQKKAYDKAYQKKYRQRNKEKIQPYNKAYCKAYYQRNKEKKIPDEIKLSGQLENQGINQSEPNNEELFSTFKQILAECLEQTIKPNHEVETLAQIETNKAAKPEISDKIKLSGQLENQGINQPESNYKETWKQLEIIEQELQELEQQQEEIKAEHEIAKQLDKATSREEKSSLESMLINLEADKEGKWTEVTKEAGKLRELRKENRLE